MAKLKKARKRIRKLEKAIAKSNTKKIDKLSGKLARSLGGLSQQQQQGLLAGAAPAVRNLLGARGLLNTPTTQPLFNAQLGQQLGLLGGSFAAPASGGADINSLIDQFLAGLQMPATGGLGRIQDRLFTPRAGASFIPPGAFAQQGQVPQPQAAPQPLAPLQQLFAGLQGAFSSQRR